MSGANNKGCIGSGVAHAMGACGIMAARGTAMAVAIGVCTGSKAGCAAAGSERFTARGLC